MKTTVKQLAAGTLLALILIGGNVIATETATEIKVSSQEMVETTLQMETWMTNESVWNTNSLNNAVFVQESESNLVLEDWMLNHEAWSLNNNFVELFETGMELEGWMINDATWNTFTNDNETELTVENWMINEKLWK